MTRRCHKSDIAEEGTDGAVAVGTGRAASRAWPSCSHTARTTDPHRAGRDVRGVRRVRGGLRAPKPSPRDPQLASPAATGVRQEGRRKPTEHATTGNRGSVGTHLRRADRECSYRRGTSNRSGNGRTPTTTQRVPPRRSVRDRPAPRTTRLTPPTRPANGRHRRLRRSSGEGRPGAPPARHSLHRQCERPSRACCPNSAHSPAGRHSTSMRSAVPGNTTNSPSKRLVMPTHPACWLTPSRNRRSSCPNQETTLLLPSLPRLGTWLSGPHRACSGHGWLPRTEGLAAAGRRDEALRPSTLLSALAGRSRGPNLAVPVPGERALGPVARSRTRQTRRHRSG